MSSMCRPCHRKCRKHPPTQRPLARIRQAGLPARSDTLQLERGPRTRVRAGPFASRAEADQAAARIRSLGLEAQVFRQDGRE